MGLILSPKERWVARALGVRGLQFHGLHNRVKIKVLYTLSELEKKEPGIVYPIRAIQWHTGCSYGYLRRKVKYWARWGYLRSELILKDNGIRVHCYQITELGRKYLNSAPLSFRVQIIFELKQYQLSRK